MRGNLAPGRHRTEPHPVYPRVCGGTDNWESGPFTTWGLSPRVRGNRAELPGNEMLRRSIPACAGEPRFAACRQRSRSVYPRVCGGTHFLLRGHMDGVGLSPRVRGNRRRRAGVGARIWSIPACAGEPAARPGFFRGGPVYPRVCGGTPRRATRTTSRRGLSPRVRGNRPWHHRPAGRRRSIPACAGEPPQSDIMAEVRWVYPRVCGGTALTESMRQLSLGLSPRVRGNPRRGQCTFHQRRSIPACAGEPPGTAGHRPRSRVYPRVCGGTLKEGWAWVGDIGLSPRVRGNRSAAGCGAGGRGSIPACAGEP